jgi:type IV secretory pathway ATPase VirB11/archaellum biosynthesis ATPase
MTSGPPLTMVDLIANGTVPPAEAAALWWAVERGASVVVAAGPRLAGKTTLAGALFPFLPENARVYVTAGPRDPLALPEGEGPIYLLVNELSNHTPYYLAGPAAQRAFQLLGPRVRLIGTLHAESTDEAVEVMRYESDIPYEAVARIDLVLVLRARRAAAGVERRLVEIGLLRPDAARPRVSLVAGWYPGREELALRPAPEGLAALAAWAGLPADQAEREVGARAALLTSLVRRSERSLEQVEAAVGTFRREGQG